MIRLLILSGLLLMGTAFDSLAQKDTPRDLYNMAVEQENNGNLKDAIFIYTRAFDQNPKFVDPLIKRGDCKLRLNDIQGAIDDYEKVLELKPKTKSVCHNLAVAQMRKGDMEGARENLDKAVSFLKKNAIPAQLGRAYGTLGAWHEKSKLYDEAVIWYDKALGLIPTDPILYYNRGLAKKKGGHLEGALEDYNEAITVKPDLIQAYLNRGNVHKKLKHYPEALKDYDHYIEQKPHYTAAWSERAQLKLFMEDYKGALADAEETLSRKPTDGIALVVRASSNFVLGNFDTVCDDLKKAREQDLEEAATLMEKMCTK